VFGQGQEPIMRLTRAIIAITDEKSRLEWDSPVFLPKAKTLRVIIKVSPTLTPAYKFRLYDVRLDIYSLDRVRLGYMSDWSEWWNFQNGQYIYEKNVNLEATGVKCYLSLNVDFRFSGLAGVYGKQVANFEMEVYDMYSPKARTTLSLRVPPSVHVGDRMTISGSISPSFSGAQIIINIVGPESRTLYTTTKDGQFNASYTPPKVGKYSVEAIFNGDSEHEASRSQAVSFETTKMPTSLTLSVSPTEGSIDVLTNSAAELRITGRIEPGIRTSIQVDIWQPDNRKVTRIVETSTDGKFSISLTPTALGPYIIEARFQGDEQHEGSSNQITVNVRASYNTVILIGVIIVLIIVAIGLTRIRKRKQLSRIQI
jgi:hypothetical protein